MLANDFDKFKEDFCRMLEQDASSLNAQTENYYHAIVFTIGHSLNKNEYFVKSEIESGSGRCDLLILPYSQNDRGFIFEFKYGSSCKKVKTYKTIEKRLVKQADEAIEQINDRHYYAIFEKFKIKHISIVGMSFFSKYMAYKKKDMVLQNRDYVEEIKSK